VDPRRDEGGVHSLVLPDDPPHLDGGIAQHHDPLLGSTTGGGALGHALEAQPLLLAPVLAVTGGEIRARTAIGRRNAGGQSLEVGAEAENGREGSVRKRRRTRRTRRDMELSRPSGENMEL